MITFLYKKIAEDTFFQNEQNIKIKQEMRLCDALYLQKNIENTFFENEYQNKDLQYVYVRIRACICILQLETSIRKL